MVVGVSIEMGKNIYRFKTKGSAQDVMVVADIIKIC